MDNNKRGQLRKRQKQQSYDKPKLFNLLLKRCLDCKAWIPLFGSKRCPNCIQQN